MSSTRVVREDPENSCGIVPNGSRIYANSMTRIGALKTQPTAWTDPFLPALHGRDGT